MKKTILTIALIAGISASAQWSKGEAGNNFDGFATYAVTGDMYDKGISLITYNKSGEDSPYIARTTTETPGYEDLSIKLINHNGDFEGNILDVLISFDKDPKVYHMDFVRSGIVLSFRAFRDNDYNLYSPFDLLQNIKDKSKIHFRIVRSNTTKDFTFNLIGSTKVLNSVVTFDEIGPGKDLVQMVGIFRLFDLWENWYEDVAPYVNVKLNEIYGEGWWIGVKNIKFYEDTFTVKVILKDDTLFHEFSEDEVDAFIKEYNEKKETKEDTI